MEGKEERSDTTVQTGSVIATIEYDGVGRRIVKTITDSGDRGGSWSYDGGTEEWSQDDMAYHYYYDGQQMTEMRDGSDNVLKQYVWGLEYVDELVAIDLNGDPETDDDCLDDDSEFGGHLTY